MKVIGRVDKADFPELSLENIDIKIDTGAFTSTIHSHDIREFSENDDSYIAFQILDPSHPMFNGEEYKTRRFKKTIVKNSFGNSEERFVVQTSIILFGEEYPIRLTLGQRADMKYPILIGRRLLNKKFLVDTSRKNLSYKAKKKNLRKKK